MRATFTDEQVALAETAAQLASGGLTAARGMLDGGAAPQEPTASLFGGFAGLGVDEAAGGLGGSLVDLAVVVHGLGTTVTPTAFVPHALALQVASAAGLDVAAAAAGSSRWALGTAEGSEPGWGPWNASPEGLVKVAVAHAEEADAVVVTFGDDGVAVVEPSARTPRRPYDPTRPAADVTAGRVIARADGGAAAGLRRAVTAVGAELVGAGRGAIDLAVAHARQREQFGQPIGRFQAVAHRLADAFTSVESAWSLVLYAAWAVSEDGPDAAVAAHAAKARAGEAAVDAGETCTQVHGGIGITWEAAPHLFVRRALASSQWLGATWWHRRQVGTGAVATHA